MAIIPSVQVFPSFQPNQVLADRDLNQTREYLESQERGTRVDAIGTGVLCGLEPRLLTDTGAVPAGGGAGATSSYRIAIAPGVGITSEGYLLALAAEETFDSYVPFPNTDPASPLPFPGSTDDDTPLIFELVDQSSYKGTDAKNLDKILAPGAALASRWGNPVVVLYLDMVPVQRQRCSFDDCDDKGIDVELHVRKLLIPASDDVEIKPYIHEQREQLNPIRPPRVVQLGTGADIAAAFRAACTDSDCLGNLSHGLMLTLRVYGEWLTPAYAVGSPFYAGDRTDPVIEQQILDALTSALARGDGNPALAQLGYDFLRDLCWAFNEFVSAAATLKAQCCPSPNAFKRHLLLGQPREYTPGELTSTFRHYFRPGTAVSNQEGLARRVVALHQRMEAMLRGYRPTAAYRGLPQIRPQREATLSPRVIPYYYDTAAGEGVREHWDPRQEDSELRPEARIPFVAPAEPAPGEDALVRNLDDQAFFRVEGHLGLAYDPQLLANLAARRDAYGLAFECVVLQAAPPPGPLSLVGADELASRIDALVAVPSQSERYASLCEELRTRLREMGAIQAVPDALRASPWLDYVSASLDVRADLQGPVAAVLAALPDGPAQFNAGAFRAAYDRLIEAVVGVLQRLNDDTIQMVTRPLATHGGPAAPGRGASPYYWLVARWIGDLRANLLRLIRTFDPNPLLAFHQHLMEQVEAWRQGDPRRLDNFIQRHPGLEHAAGVPKGGTFVLVHDGSTFFADFQLPYRWYEDAVPVATARYVPVHCYFIERGWSEAVPLQARNLLLGDDAGLELAVQVGSQWLPIPTEGGVEVWDQPTSGGGAPQKGRLDWQVTAGWETLLTFNRPKDISGRNRFHFHLRTQRTDASGAIETEAEHHVWMLMQAPVLLAHDDEAVTVEGKPVGIDFLSNDLLPAGIDPGLKVEIVTLPSHGKLGAVIEGLHASAVFDASVLFTAPDPGVNMTIALKGRQTAFTFNAAPFRDTAVTLAANLNRQLQLADMPLRAILNPDDSLELRHLEQREDVSFTISLAKADAGAQKINTTVTYRPGRAPWLPWDDPRRPELAAGQVHYLPNPGFVGLDSFSYRVQGTVLNALPLEATAQVRVHVAACCDEQQKDEPPTTGHLHACLDRVRTRIFERLPTVDKTVFKPLADDVTAFRKRVGDKDGIDAYLHGGLNPEILKTLTANFGLLKDQTQKALESLSKDDLALAVDLHVFVTEFALCLVLHEDVPFPGQYLESLQGWVRTIPPPEVMAQFPDLGREWVGKLHQLFEETRRAWGVQAGKLLDAITPPMPPPYAPADRLTVAFVLSLERLRERMLERFATAADAAIRKELESGYQVFRLVDLKPSSLVQERAYLSGSENPQVVKDVAAVLGRLYAQLPAAVGQDVHRADVLWSFFRFQVEFLFIYYLHERVPVADSDVTGLGTKTGPLVTKLAGGRPVYLEEWNLMIDGYASPLPDAARKIVESFRAPVPG